MVVVAVQRGGRGVQTLGTAVHRDGATIAFQHAAAGAQLGLHSRDAVALLQAQPLGVADDGGALAQQSQHHQHGAKVGAVRKVDIHPVQGSFCKGDAVAFAGEHRATPAQNVQNGSIALQSIRRKAGDGQPAAHRAQHRRESSLTVIALHVVVAGAVLLPARQQQGGFVQPAAVHPKGGLHGAGHVDVAAALHGGDKVQGAIPGQQRQREQQPADELTGHVARQPVVPGGQCALHGQPGRGLLKP